MGALNSKFYTYAGMLDAVLLIVTAFALLLADKLSLDEGTLVIVKGAMLAVSGVLTVIFGALVAMGGKSFVGKIGGAMTLIAGIVMIGATVIIMTDKSNFSLVLSVAAALFSIAVLMDTLGRWAQNLKGMLYIDAVIFIIEIVLTAFAFMSNGAAAAAAVLIFGFWIAFIAFTKDAEAEQTNEIDPNRKSAKKATKQKAKKEAELQKEQEKKAKLEAQAKKAKLEADKKSKEEAEQKVKADAEKKAKHEADKKSKEEAEAKAKAEAEAKAKKDADAKAEAEAKAKAETEARAKEEAEKKAKEEAEKKAKLEAEQKAKAEAEAKAKEEAEAKAKAEAEKKAKEEAEAKAKAEAEQKAKEEAEAKEKAEAEAKAKEAASKVATVAVAEEVAKAEQPVENKQSTVQIKVETKKVEEPPVKVTPEPAKTEPVKAEPAKVEEKPKINTDFMSKLVASKDASTKVSNIPVARIPPAPKAEEKKAVDVPEEEPVEEIVEEPESDSVIPADDPYTDYSPEALVRRAAWNKGYRCRREYGDYKIPVAFVKTKVAVFVVEPDADTSMDAKLTEEGWIVLRFDINAVTDGQAEAEKIAEAIKQNTRAMKATAKKKKKPAKK